MLRPESAAEQRLRQDVRDWLRANTPEELRHLTFRPAPRDIMPWYRAVYERGWIAPHWPREHGGMGATPVEQVILIEEMAAFGAPDIPSQGINQIGPLLIKFGSAAQRAQHLPRMLSGEAIWCQGYSEPGAGSDLASLRARASRAANSWSMATRPGPPGASMRTGCTRSCAAATRAAVIRAAGTRASASC